MDKPDINYDEILKLIALLDEKKLSHFELEVEGFKIRLSKNTSSSAIREHKSGSASPTSPTGSTAPDAQAPESATPDHEPNLHFITSPMVGTFYRAPNPTSAPFVEPGEPVRKKQTLCIIEAMKLMNEIESDIEGIVKEIYVENAKPVEFGQKLFSILKSG